MAADPIVFGILGPLQVHCCTGDLRRGNKRELVLGALLLEANRPVAVERLVEAVWLRPPRSALANIQTYISSLRAALPHFAAGPRIQTLRSGYLLSADPGELDCVVFEDLIAEATRLTGQGEQGAALAALDRALTLWRGEPLSDLPPAAWWQPRIDRIVALYRQATEARLRLRIALGQYGSALSELRLLLAEDPFQEDLWRHLLVALTANGRPAAALAAYRQARDLMVHELGIEPGVELQRTHEAILRGESPVPAEWIQPPAGPPADLTPPPALSPAPAPALSPTPVAALPPSRHQLRQLPRDLIDFTGRDVEVAALSAELRNTAASCPVTVLTGPPGIGKTALAVRVGHLVAECFPDGQLYADLGGDGGEPPSPADVLADLLRALGVRDDDQPARTAGRAALYRSLLAGRRMLVVVDAASSSAQVAPLVPAVAGCAVLVTSQRRLPDLIGASEFGLDVLPIGGAQELLTRLIGAERAAREPAAVRSIVEACGGHPLALRIAGIRIAGRPPWSLRMFAERLAEDSRRFDELRTGDLAVRDHFDASLRRLPEDATQVFRLIGQLDDADLPGWVADSLLGRVRAAAALDALVDAGLVRVVGPDAADQPRYRVSALLRCYARALSTSSTTVRMRRRPRSLSAGLTSDSGRL